jgi:hypothetical protein
MIACNNSESLPICLLVLSFQAPFTYALANFAHAHEK